MSEPGNPIDTGAHLARSFVRLQHALLERIRGMLGAGVRQMAESTDFLQEVFVELCLSRQAADLSDESLLRFLTAIARNNIRDVDRRRRCRAFQCLSDSICDDAPRPADELSGLERIELLANGLMQLRKEHREVIELRDIQGLRFREIGQRLNRSEDASRKLHSRAVFQLGLHLHRRPRSGGHTDA
jgi:RNA polymerase sigma factor (sigma-70 family)